MKYNEMLRQPVNTVVGIECPRCGNERALVTSHKEKGSWLMCNDVGCMASFFRYFRKGKVWG